MDNSNQTEVNDYEVMIAILTIGLGRELERALVDLREIHRVQNTTPSDQTAMTPIYLVHNMLHEISDALSASLTAAYGVSQNKHVRRDIETLFAHCGRTLAEMSNYPGIGALIEAAKLKLVERDRQHNAASELVESCLAGADLSGFENEE